MKKLLDGIWPLRRMKGGRLSSGEVIVAQNIGIRPDGSLQVMRPAHVSEREL